MPKSTSKAIALAMEASVLKEVAAAFRLIGKAENEIEKAIQVGVAAGQKLLDLKDEMKRKRPNVNFDDWLEGNFTDAGRDRCKKLMKASKGENSHQQVLLMGLVPEKPAGESTKQAGGITVGKVHLSLANKLCEWLGQFESRGEITDDLKSDMRALWKKLNGLYGVETPPSKESI